MKFSLATVLTVTTGKLLTDISNLYVILEHMTGETPYTHSLGRFADKCRPALLMRFPELGKASNRTIRGQAEVDEYLSQCAGMQEYYDIGSNCVSIEYINPINELQEMMDEV